MAAQKALASIVEKLFQSLKGFQRFCGAMGI